MISLNLHKMRWCLLILITFFFYSGLAAQADTAKLHKLVRQLDKALLEKDTVTLSRLLDAEVTFGHSNGWVETKAHVIRDVSTGYLVYEQLVAEQPVIVLGKDWASVRLKLAAKGEVNKKAFDLQLYVLQVWKKVKNEWKLIARQSAKL